MLISNIPPRPPLPPPPRRGSHVGLGPHDTDISPLTSLHHTSMSPSLLGPHLAQYISLPCGPYPPGPSPPAQHVEAGCAFYSGHVAGRGCRFQEGDWGFVGTEISFRKVGFL
ncbi:uncharacterized protein G2W53_035923 [Senna tora]|uniref:Uncharacterized protein n=1 Tax=Senna tora TaxID=362788 RepID=A0A834W4C3_9FABA|nr:uncharacterized protein G2W53_035923 [Senna tora]